MEVSDDVDAFKQTVTAYTGATQRPRWDFWGTDINQAMINDFITAVRDGCAPCISGMDGFRATQIALGTYESIKTGQPVRLK